MKKEDIIYFKKEKDFKNRIFLSRFPDLEIQNNKILDLGCGHGALSIDLAIMSAKKVIGIDLDENRINFAIENLRINYPQLINKVIFKNCELSNIEGNSFDIIISKATFEHIIQLEDLMQEILAKLIVGGKLYTGFGPLYNSPWGDHNRLRHRLPWGHLILSQNILFKKLNKNNSKEIKSINDLGLNGLSLKDYKRLFFSTKGLKVIDFRTNVSTKLINKVFKLLTFIPFLEEYFTHNIYCVLQRTE